MVPIVARSALTGSGFAGRSFDKLRMTGVVAEV
jgi:hypothetical protein